MESRPASLHVGHRRDATQAQKSCLFRDSEAVWTGLRPPINLHEVTGRDFLQSMRGIVAFHMLVAQTVVSITGPVAPD